MRRYDLGASRIELARILANAARIGPKGKRPADYLAYAFKKDDKLLRDRSGKVIVWTGRFGARIEAKARGAKAVRVYVSVSELPDA